MGSVGAYDFNEITDQIMLIKLFSAMDRGHLIKKGCNTMKL